MLAVCRTWLKSLTHRPPAEASLEQLFLLHAANAALLQFTARNNSLTPAQRRDVATTVTYLLSFLRERTHREQLLKQRELTVDGMTYAFRAQGTVILLGVIYGEHELAVALESFDAVLHEVYTQHGALLGELDTNPGLRLPRILPELSS